MLVYLCLAKFHLYYTFVISTGWAKAHGLTLKLGYCIKGNNKELLNVIQDIERSGEGDVYLIRHVKNWTRNRTCWIVFGCTAINSVYLISHF